MDSEQQPIRAFKGIWIPKDIWENMSLTLTERCLLADIHSYDEGRGCFASNEFLARRFDVTKERMANLISKLRKDGWLKDLSDNINRRLLKVYVPKGITKIVIHENRYNENRYNEKRDDGITKNVSPHISEKTVERKDKTGDGAPVSKLRRKAPVELRERAQEREQFKNLWIAAVKDVKDIEYIILDAEFMSLKTLINTGKSPQGLINMARDAWAHPEFGWNCANLKSLTNFAKRFHEIESELKQRKNEGIRNSSACPKPTPSDQRNAVIGDNASLDRKIARLSAPPTAKE